MAEDFVIEMLHITKEFPGIKANDDVTLQLRRGEVHALFWDGVGLGLKWKTRRIRGSVAAVDLADFNNDGILDLVVGLNTSPDLGVGSRQCIVTAYPLDVSQMNPNAPADLSDFEVTPNY